MKYNTKSKSVKTPSPIKRERMPVAIQRGSIEPLLKKLARKFSCTKKRTTFQWMRYMTVNGIFSFLSKREICVLLAVLFHISNKIPHRGQAWMGQLRLAKETGIRRNHIGTVLRSLQGKHIIYRMSADEHDHACACYKLALSDYLKDEYERFRERN